MTRDDIEGFVLRHGDPHDGQGCGEVVIDGKQYDAYWDVYDIQISGAGETMPISLGYLLPDYQMFEFRGPSFVYRLRNGKFVRQPADRKE